jgi:hypothetical protein
MARIRIEDLPPHVQLTPEEVEKLTPEEIERIFGAGRRPYHLEMEALEARDMQDAGMIHAVGVFQPRGVVPQPANVRMLRNDNQPVVQQQLGANEFNALMESGGGTTIGTQTFQLANGYSATLRTFKMGNDIRHDVDIVHGSDKVLVGREQADGTYQVQLIKLGVGQSWTTFDRFGGKWDEAGNAWVPQANQKLQARGQNQQGQSPIQGEWKAGKWVETSGSTTETYQAFGTQWYQDNQLKRDGTKLLKRVSTNGDGSTVTDTLQQDGKWSERIQGSKQFRDQTSVYDQLDGNRHLLSQDTTKNNGTRVQETYDGNGNLLTRTTSSADLKAKVWINGEWKQVQVNQIHGEWQQMRGQRLWAETTTGPKEFKQQINYYKGPGADPETALFTTTDRLDGMREVLTREAASSDDILNRTEVYNQDNQLVSRDTTYYSHRIRGEWQQVQGQRRWVETWIKPLGDSDFLPRTDVYDKPDGKLVSRDTVTKDNLKVHGDWEPVQGQTRWVETTTGSNDFLKRIDVYDNDSTITGTHMLSEETFNKDGSRQLTTYNITDVVNQTDVYNKDNVLVSRSTIFKDGRTVTGLLKNNQWVETTTGSKEFQTRTEVYDKVGGKLLTRDTTYVGEHARTVHGEWKQVQGQRRWVETTTGSKEFQKRTEVYDAPDGKRLTSDTKNNDNSFTYGELKVDGRWVETTYPGSGYQWVEVGGVQAVKILTSDGYQIVYGGKVIACSRISDGQFIEESWQGGIYSYRRWSMKDGKPDQVLAEVTIANGKMTYKQFRVQGVEYWWHGKKPTANSATLTWEYAVNADGTLGELSQYQINADGGYIDTWTKGYGWDVKKPSYGIWYQVPDSEFAVRQQTMYGLDLRGITTLSEGLTSQLPP